MKTITKRFTRLGSVLIDTDARFEFAAAPVPEVSREQLERLLQPGMVPATGDLEPRYAPTCEGVPPPPGVPATVTRDGRTEYRFGVHCEAEREETGQPLMLACWFGFFALVALLAMAAGYMGWLPWRV